MSLALPTPISPFTAIAIRRSAICATPLPPRAILPSRKIERYLTGHAGKDVHARYGDQWIKTLKAAIEVIPNPLAVCKWERSSLKDLNSPISRGAFVLVL